MRIDFQLGLQPLQRVLFLVDRGQFGNPRPSQRRIQDKAALDQRNLCLAIGGEVRRVLRSLKNQPWFSCGDFQKGKGRVVRRNGQPANGDGCYGQRNTYDQGHLHTATQCHEEPQRCERSQQTLQLLTADARAGCVAFMAAPIGVTIRPILRTLTVALREGIVSRHVGKVGGRLAIRRWRNHLWSVLFS